MPVEQDSVVKITSYQLRKIREATSKEYLPPWVRKLQPLNVPNNIIISELLWGGPERHHITKYVKEGGLTLENEREIMTTLQRVSYPMVDGDFPLGSLANQTIVATVRELHETQLISMGLNIMNISILSRLLPEDKS